MNSEKVINLENQVINAWPAIIYFFPGNGDIPDELKPRFADENMSRSASGPDGVYGKLITPSRCSNVEYNQDTYKWRKLKSYSLGVKKNYEPYDFIRESALGRYGYGVKLGDGKTWNIPVAFVKSYHFSFPTCRKLDDDGNITIKPKDEHIHICRLAETIWDNIRSEDGKPGSTCDVGSDAQFDMACEALSINYNLSKLEIAAMELMTESGIAGIFQALIDEPGWLEIKEIFETKAQKKTSGQ
jgi:hypothetical protein